MRTLRIAVVVSLVMAVGQHSSAQSLTFSLLERYLESLRDQAGIPGMSATVVQGGRVAWEAGFGMQNVERAVRATPDTPYPIADLSQTFAAAMLLDRCVDHGTLEINDRMLRWVSQYPDTQVTVAQILSHTTPSGSYRYDPSRFADLAGVVDQCTSARYQVRVASDVFDAYGMTRTVPGEDLADSASPARRLFTADRLSRYVNVLGLAATPYRVDSRGRPTASSYSAKSLTAAVGVVSTVRDLARFDNALDVLVDPDTLNAAWQPGGGSRPTGLGWFVQTYKDEKLVWHFGLARDAYSSLILKVPSKGLTFILLANSDALSAPYSLEKGDVTKSLFAQVFLKLFVP